MYSKRLILTILLATCALLVLGSTAMAATVTTDTTDYPRGSTVYISGDGFWPGEVVTLQVTHADGDPPDGLGHDPWDVVADGSGSFSSSWYVEFDDNLGETLLLTAEGQSSGLLASTTFTDNVGTNLDQLQNGTSSQTPEWANGNINSSNSCYSEGDGVPFRYFLTGVASGEKYRFTIQSEWTKGGINAYDYFVDYNITEATALAYVGDVCGTIATAVPGDCNPVLLSSAFPDPTNAGNYTGTLPGGFFPFGFPVDAPANLKSYGAVVDSMGPYFFTGTASDLELNLYVYVSITQTGSAGFFWAGHLAEGTPAAWGIGLGAASVGGAPYHMRAVDVKEIVGGVPTGSGAKNQDRSIQNGTICLPPDATISCSAPSLGCANLSSSCSAPAGADSYEWTIIGGTLDSGQATTTVYYTATSDTVYVYLTACSSTGACPGDFCCNQDSVWIPVDLDTTPPVITQCPADIDLGCNPSSIPSCDPGAILATDPCGTPGVSCQQIGSDAQSGCTFTRTYRYYVTDPSGNVDSCDQIITWTSDTEKPVFTVCPADADLGCNPTSIPGAAAGDATATDNCGTPSVGVVQGTPSNSGCAWSRTDVWTATDGCGNTETCSRTLTWTMDTENPVFTSCPSDQDLGCNPASIPDAAAGDATATDNCGAPAVTVAQGSPTNDGCAWSRTDTWTATDGCGNTATCSRTITWTSDTEKPVFTVCPADADLGCNPASIPAAAAGDATATDNCGTPSVGVVQGTPSNNGCAWSRTDTWTATDGCGNTETCSRTLTWTMDTEDPVFTSCPGDQDLGCNPVVPTAAAGDATATDNCGSPAVTVAEGTPTNNGCAYSRTDIWTATDGCGNTATCSRTITWTQDTEDPVFTVCPSDQDLGCNPTVPDAAAGDASATDNCGAPSVGVVQGTPVMNGCMYSRTDTWTATDGCGNTATCSRTLTWTTATTPPVFTLCPGDQDLGCNPTVPPASLGEVTVSSDCGADVTLAEGTPTSDGCLWTRTDVWTATNPCGAQATCTRTYTWTVDTEDPVFTSCPADADLGCNPQVPDAQAGDATAGDNCGTPSIGVVQGTPTNNGCDYSRTDVWTATDGCGNSATCSRTLTWTQDAENPVFTLCPADADLGCNPTAIPDAAAGDATATDNCGAPTVGVVQGTPSNDGCDYSRTDVWTATDGCGNSETCSRTLTWTVDTEAPVFTSCPGDQDLGCDPQTIPNAQAGDATATDNCGDPTVTVSQGSAAFDGCLWSRTDEWTAEDGCGNSATCSRTLTWKINTPPVASCPGDRTVFLCEASEEFCIGPFAWTDPDCNESVSESVSIGTLLNGQVCFTADTVGTYVIDYTVTDACGAADTCRTTVYVSQPQILIDTLTSLQNTTVEVCVRVNGMSFPWGGFDFLLNYDPIVLQFVEAVPGDFIVDCGWEYFTYRLVPSASQSLIRLVAIADINNSNHHPTCKTPDSGAVIFCLRFKVTNDRTLACQATPIRFWWEDCGDNAVSDTTGNILYIGGDLPLTVVDAAGNDYTGFPNIGGPPLPCPSDKFVSVPCIEYRIGKVRLICPGEIDDRGDLNLNGIAYEISDAVLYSQYFIGGAGVLVMGTPPGEAQIAASDINADGNPLTVADLVYLIRVITGDVLPVPDDYIGGPKLASSAGTMQVTTASQGQALRVSTASDQDLGAVHFVFNYDKTTITNVAVTERAQDMDIEFRAQNGVLNVLVYNIQDRARIVAGLGDILEITTTGGGSVELASVEAATFMGGALDVQFAGKAVMPEKFALHQNFPNPFNPSTSFAIDFPTATDYTLTVYNVTGQIVRTFTGHAPAGTTTISWQGKDNHGATVASGVYLYRLKAGDFEAIRKMVLMK